jgi:hypothetical protein
MHGAIIKTIKRTSRKQTFDVSDLQTGVYFLTGKNDTSRFTKKIIKI